MWKGENWESKQKLEMAHSAPAGGQVWSQEEQGKSFRKVAMTAKSTGQHFLSRKVKELP